RTRSAMRSANTSDVGSTRPWKGPIGSLWRAARPLRRASGRLSPRVARDGTRDGYRVSTAHREQVVPRVLLLRTPEAPGCTLRRGRRELRAPAPSNGHPWG